AKPGEQCQFALRLALKPRSWPPGKKTVRRLLALVSVVIGGLVQAEGLVQLNPLTPRLQKWLVRPTERGSTFRFQWTPLNQNSAQLFLAEWGRLTRWDRRPSPCGSRCR